MLVMTRRRRRGRSLAEYFVAFIGLAFLVLLAALIATSGSCRVRVSPEVGIQAPTPHPTATAQP
jgi:hypothetical protein